MARAWRREARTNTVRLWDVETGEELATLRGHEGTANPQSPLAPMARA